MAMSIRRRDDVHRGPEACVRSFANRACASGYAHDVREARKRSKRTQLPPGYQMEWRAALLRPLARSARGGKNLKIENCFRGGGRKVIQLLQRGGRHSFSLHLKRDDRQIILRLEAAGFGVELLDELAEHLGGREGLAGDQLGPP